MPFLHMQITYKLLYSIPKKRGLYPKWILRFLYFDSFSKFLLTSSLPAVSWDLSTILFIGDLDLSHVLLVGADTSDIFCIKFGSNVL